MHGVQGIADQNQPPVIGAAGELQPEGIAPARPGQGEIAEEIAETALQLGQETGVVQLHDAARQPGRLGPHQRAAIAGQRQDGEGPRGQEVLVGDIPM